MKYYKAYKLSEEQEIVLDAFDENITYCKYVDASKCIISCGINENPQGIISIRNNTKYHVNGWPDLSGDYDTVILSEISKSEYEELEEKFKKEDEETAAIKELRKKINEQGFSINTLIGAIIDIGDIIGGAN